MWRGRRMSQSPGENGAGASPGAPSTSSTAVSSQVHAGDPQPHPGPQVETGFEATRAGVGDVVGAEPARVAERLADRHDQIGVAIREPRGLGDERTAEPRLFETDIDAAAAFRAQGRIVGERDLEAVRRTDAGAGARAHACPAGTPCTGAREEPRRGNLRVGRDHRVGSERRATHEGTGIAGERRTVQALDAQARDDVGGPALVAGLGERADDRPLDGEHVSPVAGDERAPRPLVERFDAGRQTERRGGRDVAL